MTISLVVSRDHSFVQSVGHSAALAGSQIPFLCTETHELGEEMVASYLDQVHLYNWLKTNDYGRFLADHDLSKLR